MTFPRKSVAAVAAALAITGLLAGCSGSSPSPQSSSGGGSDSDSGPSKDNPVAITVGTLPAGDYAPLYIAQQEGYFEDEGLDVTIETIAGGAVGVTQLVSGELQFTSATWANVLAAVSQGLELQVVREGTNAGKEGINGVIVAEDSGINSPKDLKGKTLSVNTLQSATEVQLRDCLATAGLKPGDYELVEVPFPEVGAAVSQGRIAGGLVPEPFITIGKSQGLKSIMSPSTCNDRQSKSPLITWNTATAYAQENPGVVAAFVRAMDKATQMAIDDPDSVREILPTFTTLTPELAKAITLPNFVEDGTPNLKGAKLTMDLMVEYKLLDKPLDDLSKYAWKGE
ncbi:ABC transporter substrate-binding protein [Naasia aerilata]|uniref:Sulfonate ABC transporter substrate-binding protein n=1 Tax=Naasia aerilata TaxID=1162966 RepID=A0ABN6XIE7_9MICO|nr:ABC transporter substrate-binding protein [Naasia aerilata]BDZ44644.1 sulfonate ABC transporter substrate-binding protein [Naasia aerilata]